MVRCWGVNDHGQLGDGTTNSSSAPLTVSLPPRGGCHRVRLPRTFLRCSMTRRSSCWGANDAGQPRDASVDEAAHAGRRGRRSRRNPRPSRPASRTRAPRTTSSIHCWGDNASGQLGDATTTSRPAPPQCRVSSELRKSRLARTIRAPSTARAASECWGLGSSGRSRRRRRPRHRRSL
ncbi:MAG: hypothetical protein IPG50_11955 [Myxococcales bacterium]|nr:hypothetical protein [Myxococcales bacterium]